MPPLPFPRHSPRTTHVPRRGFSSYALDLPSARGCFAAELLRRAVSALTELRQLGQLQQVVLLGHSSSVRKQHWLKKRSGPSDGRPEG